MEYVQFSGFNLTIDGQTFLLEYPIKEARIINNNAVVLFKDSDLSPTYFQFKNCKAFNGNGELVWVAEHPTTEINDFYMNFIGAEKLKLRNFSSYTCEIDFATGEIIDVTCD